VRVSTGVGGRESKIDYLQAMFRTRVSGLKQLMSRFCLASMKSDPKPCFGGFHKHQAKLRLLADPALPPTAAPTPTGC